jgi:hypothetical protein
MRSQGSQGRVARAQSTIIFVMALAIAAVWYKPFLHYTPYDYSRWLGPWYRHILDVGPASAFSEPFGNYTPPYLYLLSAATLLDRIVPPLISIKI